MARRKRISQHFEELCMIRPPSKVVVPPKHIAQRLLADFPLQHENPVVEDGAGTASSIANKRIAKLSGSDRQDHLVVRDDNRILLLELTDRDLMDRRILFGRQDIPGPAFDKDS